MFIAAGEPFYWQGAGKAVTGRFPAWERLEKTGQGLFRAPEDLAPRPAEEVVVKQGYLEQSNVDVIREMTDLIATMRIYEMNQKAIQTQDEILGKSVNEVGSIR